MNNLQKIIGAASVCWSCESAHEYDARLGKYVSVTASAQIEMCLGSAEHVDSYIEQVVTFLGSDDVGSLDIPVHLVDDVSWCNDTGRIACYSPRDKAIYMKSIDGAGYRTFGVLRHELGHALIDKFWGRSISFLEEGLAETLGRASEDVIYSGPPSGPLRKEMLNESPLTIDYLSAARFARFAIDTYGLNRFKALFTGLPHGASEEMILEKFEAVYGRTFDTLNDEYASGHARCAYQIESCTSAPISVPFAWTTAVVVDCSDPRVFGHEEGQIGSIITFRISRSGLYRLRSDSSLTVSRCGDCNEQMVERLNDLENDVVMKFEAGVYSFEFNALGEPHGTVSVALFPERVIE